MRVEAIQGSTPPAALGEAAPVQPSPASSFGNFLLEAVHEASALDKAADAKGKALAEGSLDDLHGTMIAAKEAEISLHLVGTIRNKLLDAFHELWRTSI
jgi:flagellar hook-basal body complex protein FliE